MMKTYVVTSIVHHSERGSVMSDCLISYGMILCNDPMHWSCAMILWNDPVQWSCAMILCNDPVQWFWAMFPCNDPLQWSCAMIPCNDPVLWSCCRSPGSVRHRRVAQEWPCRRWPLVSGVSMRIFKAKLKPVSTDYGLSNCTISNSKDLNRTSEFLVIN